MIVLRTGAARAGMRDHVLRGRGAGCERGSPCELTHLESDALTGRS